MSYQNESQDRWFAYYLGELPESERKQVEAELANAPEEAELVRETINAASAWARQSEPFEPLSLDTLIQSDVGAATSNGRPTGVPRWFWAMAAAAMLLLAISQTQFNLTIGNTTLAWGRPAELVDLDSSDSLNALAQRLDTVESGNTKALELIESVAERTLAVEESATALAYNQQLEAETRYRDMLTLMQQLSGGDELASAVYETR